MKRILHVIGGMNRAGAESMTMTLYRALDKTKYQFDFLVYSEDHQDFEDEIISLGGNVIHMPLNGGIISLFKSIKKVRKILKENGPYSAIHASTLHNSAFALMAAVGLKCRKITHSHNTCNIPNPSALMRLYNHVTKYIIRLLTDECIACGSEAGKYLFGEKLFSKKGIVLHNSVDFEYFNNVKIQDIEYLKNEFGISDELIIGSVARLEEVKNHKKMIAIASELKKMKIRFKLIFVGRGMLENDLKAMVNHEDLNDCIIFAGVRSDINVMMHLFDVFLMPSLFEGNPVTLIEAQAAGLPSLISDTITSQIDLGLDLIKRLDINIPEKEWANVILEIKRPIINKERILESIKSNGYDLNQNLSILTNLYNNNTSVIF